MNKKTDVKRFRQVQEDIQKALLEMLAFVLFGAKPDFSGVNKPNWPLVFNEAVEQAVLPMVLDKVMDLPPEQQPGQAVLDMYRGLAVRQIVRNERLMAAQEVLIGKLAQAGVSCLVLKGSSVAFAYPKPELRVLGDIDLLVKRGDLEKASGVLNSMGYAPSIVNEEFHLGFDKDIVHAEIHFEANNYPDTESGREIRALMADAVSQAGNAVMNQYRFPVLSDERQAVTLLLHKYYHMAGIGIGLRQVCDFAVFVNQVGPEAWQKNIGPVLRRCGLLRFAEILAKACVLFLGLPQSRAPWCEQADAGLSRALLEEFLNSGNFGNKQSSQRASSILSADKAGSGHQSRMPTLVIRNINAYARKNYRLARRFPISLPFFWFYLPLKFLVSKRGSGESASPLRLLLEGRRRKRLFDALEVFKPDTGG